MVHLFWAERVFGEADAIPNVPDAVMYAVWDGSTWSEPIDVFLTPQENFNRKIAAIRGVLDDQGNIHLIWMGPDDTFFYSSAPANEANSAAAWRKPLKLADNQAGTQNSLDLTYEPPHTLHLLYGRSEEDAPRSVVYIQSVDGGLTWSEPTEIYVFSDLERGASNIKVKTDEFHPNRIYATWTEWDPSGNGQAILFARSLDGGNAWDYPVTLDETVGTEYERDWTNLAVLDENQLVVLWEGGFRAYPQTQYSYDGGVTWSEPTDTFHWLIADNGFASFARDGAGRLHTFLPRRIREGYDYLCDRFAGCRTMAEDNQFRGQANALWHSVWEGGTHWRDPLPAGGFQSAAGESIAVGGGISRQRLLSCVVRSRGRRQLPRSRGLRRPQLPPATPTAEPAGTLLENTPVPTPTVVEPTSSNLPQSSDSGSESNPGLSVLLGVIPALALILIVAMFQKFGSRSS